MKKLYTLLTCTIAAMAIVSCSKEIENNAETPEAKLFPMTITATSTETKTELVDRVSIKWLSTDKLSVFDGAGNQEFTSNGEGKTVTFSGETTGAETYYALYPYNETATLSGTTVATTLPSNQEAKAGSFADGLNINASKSATTEFTFTNVLSVAKISIAAANLDGHTIKSVELSSTYPLAGDVVVSYGENITAAAGTNAVNAITLEGAESGLSDGDYFFCLLPNAGGEITLTFTDTEGQTATKTATLSKAFSAGSIKNLGTVKGLTWKDKPSYKIEFIDKTNGSPSQISATTNASTVIENGSLIYVTSQPFSNASNAYYGGDKTTGLPLRIGKASEAGTLTIELSETGCVSATSIIVNAKQYSDGKTKTIGVNNSTKQQPGDEYEDLEFAINSDIEEISLQTDGYIYVKYVKVVYTPKKAVTLSFPQASYSITAGDSFTAPTLTTDPAGLTVTYSSSDESIAKVNASTGEISLEGGIGSTTITAAYAGDDEYKSGSAYYTLTVNRALSTSISQIKEDLNGSTTQMSFTASLTDAVVTRKYSNAIAYIQDDTAGILVTDAADLSEGDSYTGTVSGTMVTANNQPKITSIDVSAATKTTGATKTPVEVTIATLIGDMSTYDGKLCKIVKAKANATLATGNNKSIIIAQGENTMTLFTRASFEANKIVSGSYYNIVGIPCLYNATNEIVVVSTADVSEASITWQLASIAVKTAPTKTTYTEGELFAPAGLVLSTTEEDTTDPSITRTGEDVVYGVSTAPSFSFDPDLTTALSTTNTSVTITYSGKSTTQTITVSEEGGGGTPLTSIVTASKVTSSNVNWTGSASETWSVNVVGGATNQNVTSEYAQVGTKNSPSTSITFSTSGISGTITSIVVDCASYSGLGTVSATVDGSAFGTQSQSIPSWSNNSGGEVTFSGSASGTISIVMTNGTSGRAMYIKSITVNYTTK